MLAVFLGKHIQIDAHQPGSSNNLYFDGMRPFEKKMRQAVYADATLQV